MNLKKEYLINTFNKARDMDEPFVFLGIEAEGVKEVICVPKKSFDDKQAFYERSYTDELVHVMNKNVFVTDVAYGESDMLDIMDL